MPGMQYQSYPCRPGPALIGYVLLAAGIILLFACIPAWAWLALLGVGLIAAGWLILRLLSVWR